MAHILFLDESGQDHQKSPYEVLGGIAVEDSRIWPLIVDLNQAEHEHFGCRLNSKALEVKAKILLKRKVFRLAAQLPPFAPEERTQLALAALEEGQRAHRENRVARHTRQQLTALSQAKLAFCSAVLELCARHQARAFASIILPTAPKPASGLLRKDYVYLFERFYLFLEDVSRSEQGIVVFDELTRRESKMLISQMAAYFQRTANGKIRASRILPEPMFVHSDLTSLIQVADLLAYIVSWAVRIKGMGPPARNELLDLADAARALRFRTIVDNEEGEFERWSFVYLDDLRPRADREGTPNNKKAVAD